MPRLAVEGVVGADAIFACLGPALKIFSRYSRVEEATSAGVGGVEGTQPGVTLLDRVHQGMILFAAGRGKALKRFLAGRWRGAGCAVLAVGAGAVGAVLGGEG